MCANWSFGLREELILKMFEDRGLRKIFTSDREKGTRRL
jgi:hypothetical protein